MKFSEIFAAAWLALGVIIAASVAGADDEEQVAP